MEENVALDSSKQKQFVKSIKGIKKLIKTTEKDEDGLIQIKPKKSKSKRREKGLVYLSHIPHGFYEHQMTQYFKQFGMVTNVRVIRSKRTGNSKGFAFVEFKEPSVAQIVAETMNNYLMGKRLIKAVYIPPEKQRHRVLRKHWNPQHNPGRSLKLNMKRSYNSAKEDAQDIAIARKLLKNLTKTKAALTEMGVDYDFFTPVDVPEALQDELPSVKTEPENTDVKATNKKKKTKPQDVTEEIKNKKNKNKAKIEEITVESKKTELNKRLNKENALVKVEPTAEKPKNKKNKAKVEVINEKPKDKGKKAAESEKATVDQKNKRKDLKKKGVAPLEEFIKLQNDDSDSDGSLEFDSDEYEKLMEDDEDFDTDSEGDESADEEASDGEEEASDDDEEVSDDDEEASDDDEEDLSDDEELSEEEESEPVVLNTKQNKKQKVKPIQNAKPVQNAKAQNVKNVQISKPVPNTRNAPPKKNVQEGKRKADKPSPVPSKKLKFEKQSKQAPTNKVFKKKK